jgi:hypothetical protein
MTHGEFEHWFRTVVVSEFSEFPRASHYAVPRDELNSILPTGITAKMAPDWFIHYVHLRELNCEYDLVADAFIISIPGA